MVSLFYKSWFRMVVRDKKTRQALVPRFDIMAERPIICPDYLRAFNHPTTELLTTPLERVTAAGRTYRRRT